MIVKLKPRINTVRIAYYLSCSSQIYTAMKTCCRALMCICSYGSAWRIKHCSIRTAGYCVFLAYFLFPQNFPSQLTEYQKKKIHHASHISPSQTLSFNDKTISELTKCLKNTVENGESTAAMIRRKDSSLWSLGAGKTEEKKNSINMVKLLTQIT